MQKLFTFLIGCVILYIFAQEGLSRFDAKSGGKPESKTNSETEKINQDTSNMPAVDGNFLERTLSNVMLNALKTEEGRIFLESLIQPLNKPLANQDSGFRINNNDFIKNAFKINSLGGRNDGKVASCGHIVTIHYEIFDKNLKIKDEIITYPLGSEKAHPGLDPVIVGMKIGETRTATISNHYFQTDQKTPLKVYKANILLKELVPQNFVDDTIKIFDDEIAYKMPLMCGNRAVYDVKITSLKDGKLLYDSRKAGKKIDMYLGDLNYPMIFSHALHNKIPVGTRTVIARGQFLKSFASPFSTIFPEQKLPEEDYFMIDFYNFSKAHLERKPVQNQSEQIKQNLKTTN